MLRDNDPVIKPGFCCVFVRVPHMNFPHYHGCSRKAVSTGPIGYAMSGTGKIGPTCAIHSTEGRAARKLKREATDRRRTRGWFALKGLTPPSWAMEK